MMPHHASLPTAARLQHRSPRPTPASHACLQDEGCPRARGLKKERSGGPRFEFFCLRVSPGRWRWREECGGGKDLSHRPSADRSQARLDSTGTIPRCSSGAGSRVPSCERGAGWRAAGWSGRRLWRLPAALCCTEGRFRHPVWLPVQNELLRRPSPLYPLSALLSCGDVRCVRTPFSATYCVGSRRSLSPGRNRSPPHGWHLCGRARDEPFRAATLGALLGAGCGIRGVGGCSRPKQAGRQGRQRPSSTGSCNGSRGRGADEVVPSRPLCLLPNALRCGWLIFVDAAASCVQFSMWTRSRCWRCSLFSSAASSASYGTVAWARATRLSMELPDLSKFAASAAKQAAVVAAAPDYV